MKTKELFDALVELAGRGVKIEFVVNACGKCKHGRYKSDPTPHWMNRWVCDKCGHEVSR